MSHSLLLALLFAAFFALGVTSLILLIRAKKDRIDISSRDPFTAGRSSWGWELNALNPENYNETGRERLQKIYLVLALQVVAGVAALMVMVS